MATAIVLNGTELKTEVTEAYIICADGGYRLLKHRVPDIVLGDFDSAEDVPGNIKTKKVPAEKNYTDGEMAIRYAKEKGEKELVIYGATGGRIDHVFANFALLKLAFSLKMHAQIKEENFTAEYVEGYTSRFARIGATVSILPLGGDILVANSCGLYYPLENLTITTEGMSRGVSNLTTAENFSVDISKGGAILIIYF